MGCVLAKNHQVRYHRSSGCVPISRCFNIIIPVQLSQDFGEYKSLSDELNIGLSWGTSSTSYGILVWIDRFRYPKTANHFAISFDRYFYSNQ